MDEVVAGQTCRGPRRRASCSAERRCVRQLTQPVCHDVQRPPARTMHPGAHRTHDEVVSGLRQRGAIAGALSTDVVAWVESITSRPRAARTRPGPPSRRVISSMVPGARRPRIGAARTRVAPSFPRRHLCTSTTSRSCSSPQLSWQGRPVLPRVVPTPTRRAFGTRHGRSRPVRSTHRSPGIGCSVAEPG